MVDRLEIVRQFGEAWGRRDLDAVMAFFADDCIYAASVGPEPGTTFRGREAVRAGIEAMFRHDGGSAVEAGRAFANGDVVFSEWVYRFPAGSGRAPAHGCDVFAFDGDLIRLKDAFRKQAAPAPMPPLASRGSHEAYRPRRFASLDPWAFGAKRIKVIAIDHRVEDEPFASEPATVMAARACAEGLLPEMDALGGHFDLGYLVLHHGEAANWVLFDWWIEGGIACQVLCRSALNRPTSFERVSHPFMACVWEATAIAHERDAWVGTMMSRRPDPEAYLGRRITAGLR